MKISRDFVVLAVSSACGLKSQSQQLEGQVIWPEMLGVTVLQEKSAVVQTVLSANGLVDHSVSIRASSWLLTSHVMLIRLLAWKNSSRNIKPVVVLKRTVKRKKQGCWFHSWQPGKGGDGIGFTLLYFKMAVMPLVPETKMADVGKVTSLGEPIGLENHVVSAHNYVRNFNFIPRFVCFHLQGQHTLSSVTSRKNTPTFSISTNRDRTCNILLLWVLVLLSRLK